MNNNPVTEAPRASFFSHLKSRWEHPLGGAYLLSWVVYNHDVLLVIFADAAYNLKLYDLKDMLPREGGGEIYARRFGIPLLLATLYVMAAPWTTPIQAVFETWALNAARKVQQKMGKKFYSAEEFDVVETSATQAHEALTRATKQAAESKQETSRVRLAYLDQLRISAQAEVAHRDRCANPPGRQFEISGKVTPELRQAITSLARFGITGHINDIFRVAVQREINLANGAYDIAFVDAEGGEPGVYSDLNYFYGLGLFDILFTTGNQPTYVLNDRGRAVYDYLINEHPGLLTTKKAG